MGIGERLVFAADLTARASTKLRMNYVLSSPTKSGGRRVKTYTLKTTTIQAGQTIELSRQYAQKSTSTVTLVPGEYTLQIQVNGRRSKPVVFNVTEG